MKIINVTAMHGRHDTVRYCIDKMPFVDKYFAFTTFQDKQFLKRKGVTKKVFSDNHPLAYKWQTAMDSLKNVEFDGVVIMGSDDYYNEAFLKFAEENIANYDMIGFTDIYFEFEGNKYYWEGYNNKRKGEPIGAGKIYSKKFLESIDYKIFDEYRSKGLDNIGWRKVKAMQAKILVTSLRENGLYLADVKDGQGMNDINRFDNLIEA
jgi:hypothetical protein